MTFIRTWVPIAGSPCPVTAFSARTCFCSEVTLRKRIGSLMPETPRVPRTATALRFFDAITVPTPERPAARCRSLMIAEYRQPASAERPTQATRSCGSLYFSWRSSSVSHTDLPQRSSAGTIRAFSFST